ncbi:MAG: hypothetical protein KGL39_44195 [Patescibacteria group bacterium]|nr:hypothetical protein [Patescibacteria group bacterium]
MTESDKLSDHEIERREDGALKRLLSTPAQPRTKKDKDATPKKRGRPPKEQKE